MLYLIAALVSSVRDTGIVRANGSVTSVRRIERKDLIMVEKNRQIIMLVDDNQVNLIIGRNMLKDFYDVYALPSAEKLFTFLDIVTPDLILLDVALPTMNGFNVLKILKANARHADIPVILITSKTEATDELEGLALGAVGYVTKPFSAAVLLKRIEALLLLKKQKAELKDFNENLIEMVKGKTAQVFDQQNLIISSVADIVEFRDAITGAHLYRTQQFMQELVNYLVEYNIYPDEVGLWENLDFIISSTKLYDLGKLFISDALLNKPGKLTPEEFEIMKSHVVKGVETIRNMGKEQAFLQYAEIVAATHHEKWDGSGYPHGLKGQDIPLLGRLMAIADVYAALTSTRPYRAPLSPEESAKIIIKDSGTHFDPVLVDVFKKLEERFTAIANKYSV